MKLYISVDMEGLAGIAHWKDETEERERFRKAMNQQVEWVLDGIAASNRNKEITKIVIADSHGGGENLSYDLLSEKDDRVWLVSGSPRPQYMMPAMDDSFDLVFFVGYHAGAGERSASMDHTYSGASIQNVFINDKLMNESTINAAYAGIVNKAPVGLVIGDSALEKQLIDDKMMPWVEYVCTKESLARFAAVYKPKAQLKAETIAAVVKVLDSDYTKIPLYTFEAPYRCRIDLPSASKCDVIQQMPGVERIGGRSLQMVNDDYTEMFNAIHGVASMGRLAYC